MPESFLRRVREQYGVAVKPFKVPVDQLDFLKGVLLDGSPRYWEDPVHALKEFLGETISDQQRYEIITSAGLSEGIAVPLQMMDKNIGVLVAGARNLSRIDIPVIKLFADQISIAIESIQLRKETEAIYAELKEAK